MNLLHIVTLLCLITSKEDLRFEYVAKQAVDTSCGYASIASLLSLYWSIETDEVTLLHTYANRNHDADSDSYSVSLLEIERIITDHDLLCRSFRMDFNQLSSAREFLPCVAYYDQPEPHYVCILGLTDDTVAVGDPSSGLTMLDAYTFDRRWSGVVTLIAADLTKPEVMNKNRRLVAEATGVSERRYEKLESWAW